MVQPRHTLKRQKGELFWDSRPPEVGLVSLVGCASVPLTVTVGMGCPFEAAGPLVLAQCAL